MPKAGHIAILGGPTGSGKTSFSIQLAQHWACPIVNADSRQVYRELNIGVAIPSPSEFKQAEHRLFGHVS
ncbi:MAG: isopentenyl transferase family protein, partial [Bacteroidia bacterium]